MTMRSIAGDLGISIPTLYRRLKAAGVNVAELRDDKTGKVTPAGAAVIADLFRGGEDDTAIQEILNGDSQSVARDTLTRDADATVEIAVLRERVRGLEDKLETVTNERDRLRGQVDSLTAMLQTEQAQRVRLLEDGQRRGRGLLAWLRRRPPAGE